MRAVQQLQQELGRDHWPCVIAGDFNCTPQEATYRFLRGYNLYPEQIERIEKSRIVHESKDTTMNPSNEDLINEEGDPDRVITRARRCRNTDGLLAVSELGALFDQLPTVRSAYFEANKALCAEGSKHSGSLYSVSHDEPNFFEPPHTAFAHYWKATLDYIFLLDPCKEIEVLGVTEIPLAPVLEPGLPRKGISASDHVSLTAQIHVSPSAKHV